MSNPNYGFILNNSAKFNTLTGNYAFNNLTGFYLTLADNNTLIANSAYRNSGTNGGFHISGSLNATLLSNCLSATTELPSAVFS